MRKTFKYRIFPNRRQTKLLERMLDACRWLYNHFLEERRSVWNSKKKSISYYAQSNTLKVLKQEYPLLSNVHSQVLQNVSTRVDLAFKAFFRRVKSSKKQPGYPRFKGRGRYDSFTYPQSGFKICKNVIKLSKVGEVKIKLHRPIQGKIKTCTVRRTPTGKWFVSFTCEIDHNPIEKSTQPIIGIDMGLERFATFSDGGKISNPRFFREEEKALSKTQRKLSTQKKGDKPWAKTHKVVARIYERITCKRLNFAHQETRKIVNKFNTICVEDLSINNMRKGNFRGINKSIGDAAWAMFLNLLDYKAAEASGRVIKVNPAYTSQTCSRCGYRHKLKLSDRVFHCPCCSLILNRDINAAENILRLGLQSLDASHKSC